MTTPDPTGAFPTILPGGKIVPAPAVPGAAGPGAKYPQWSVNTTGWVVAEVVNAQEKTLAEVSTFPDKLVFFTSQAAAEQYARSQGGTPVTSPLGQLGGQAALNAGSRAAAAVGNPLDWLSNIGQFFSVLTQRNTWQRIIKVLIGAELVIAGLIKLTGTDKAVYGIAGQAASKLPGM